ncbi:MAG: 4-(cytidine 5'-diphospho)-2-C-methyl-D-erythritol kinase [Terriglobia bacterium]
MNDWLRLPAFAKINLGLELLGRRSDGYWEIATFYQTVGLCDRLRLRLRRAADIRLRVEPAALPADSRNLVWRALALARRRFGIRQGVEVELKKNIPVARGLGGGSSDAAAALIGLLRLVRRQVELTELARLGARLGADAPFFFLGGRALGVGRGDEVYALDDLPKTYCLLVCPAQAIPTRRAYAWVPSVSGLTLRRRASILCGSSRMPGCPWGMGNDFEAVVFPRFPELARIKRQLAAGGAQVTALSGSGSTVFGLFRQRAAVLQARRRCPAGATVLLTETLSRARYARALGFWGVVQW